MGRPDGREESSQDIGTRRTMSLDVLDLFAPLMESFCTLTLPYPSYSPFLCGLDAFQGSCEPKWPLHLLSLTPGGGQRGKLCSLSLLTSAFPPFLLKINYSSIYPSSSLPRDTPLPVSLCLCCLYFRGNREGQTGMKIFCDMELLGNVEENFPHRQCQIVQI